MDRHRETDSQGDEQSEKQAVRDTGGERDIQSEGEKF